MTNKPKQILISKRANIFYLDHVRVMQKDERIVYMTDQGSEISQYFNIPDRNTALLLLGKGSSITDAAARRLAESNVIVGFCGSGGTPLFSTGDFVFLSTQSEYRPTEYMQEWARCWFDEPTRLNMARQLIHERISLCRKTWSENTDLLKRSAEYPNKAENVLFSRINSCRSSQDILLAEAEWAKALYAALSKTYRISFTRSHGDGGRDTIAERVNSFLDHGNYLAYGLAAVALNGLGISFSFPLLHGKTRRGALVFDIADMIKDAYVMPCAFECGINLKISDKDFRAQLIDIFHSSDVLDLLFDTTKNLSAKSMSYWNEKK